MYFVINKGRIVGRHVLFSSAWLQARVDYQEVYSLVIGPDGYWTVNPPLAN